MEVDNENHNNDEELDNLEARFAALRKGI